MRNKEGQPAQSQNIDKSAEKDGGKGNRFKSASPFHSQMLGSDVDDFEFDDDDPAPNAKYCIQKEEYPPELLRAFDIV